MAEIDIVIKIPKEDYEDILNGETKASALNWSTFNAIRNGTPLPKGHGKLIDADEYKEHLYACETNGRPLHRMELDEILATVDNAPTIIEADKEESEV